MELAKISRVLLELHNHNEEVSPPATTTTYSPIAMMIGVCFFMFLGAFISGQLGRGKRNSAKELVWLNLFGVGLLLGTALGISKFYLKQT